MEEERKYYIKAYPEDDHTCLHYVTLKFVKPYMTPKGEVNTRIGLTHRKNEAALMTRDYASKIQQIMQEVRPDNIYKIVESKKYNTEKRRR